MTCKICEQIKNKELKTYFETPEITVLKINENLVLGTFKEHLKDIPEGKSSGLIKIMLQMLARHNTGSKFNIKRDDECIDHFAIYATIINKKE
jgi:polynucleotide 5'-kinase involved in rRNA processing